MNNSKNKTTAINIASTIVLNGIAFATAPYFSAVLGTDNYGITAVYLSWVQAASTVFTLQAGATIALARNKYTMDDQNKFQSSVLSLASISYLICAVITALVVFFFFNNDNNVFPLTLVGLAHGWGMYCISFFNSKFTYEFKPGSNFILSVLV